MIYLVVFKMRVQIYEKDQNEPLFIQDKVRILVVAAIPKTIVFWAIKGYF